MTSRQAFRREESGIADFRVDEGLFAPAGTAKPTVEKIGRAVIDVVKTPEVKSRTAAIGFEPRGDGPDAVVEIIRASLPKWAEIIRRSGLERWSTPSWMRSWT